MTERRWGRLVLALALVACGRSDLDQVVSAGGTGGTSGGAGGVKASGGAGGIKASGGASGSGGIGSGSGGSGGSGSGGSSGTGGARGATPIKCGTATCQPPREQCCVTDTPGGVISMCASTAAPCPTGYAETCVDATPCASNQICCTLTPGNGAPGTTCMPADFCGAARGRIVCTVDADCPAASRRCCRGSSYGTCAASCTIQ